MRLLLTADTIGGVWTYAIELCGGLKNYGVKIALATMGRKLSAEQHRQVNRLSHVELFESSYRLCWMSDPWDDVEQAGDWLLRVARHFRPDIVHLNDLGHGSLDWQAPVLLVGHSCVLSWWQAVKKEPAPMPEWRRYRNLVRHSVHHATMLAAPSSAMLNTLLHHYGPAQDSRIIKNGSDFQIMTPCTVLPSEKSIFAAGRLWDEAKNIALLARVARQINWPVYVAGDPGEDIGCGDSNYENVHMLGLLGQNELACRLAHSAIFAAPAFYEPFGLSILEAARSGCALVLGGIPSLREIWGEAAEYVNPESPEELRQVLGSLVDDPERRRQMAEQARRRSMRYSASRMAANYRHCYDLLLKNRPELQETQLKGNCS